MDDLVTVIFGGPSPEHEISILTGLQCERVLANAGRRVQSIYWDRFGSWFLVPAETEARDYLNGAPTGASELSVRLGSEAGWARKKGLRSANVEVGTVLNCFHGGLGEGGGAQALFALLGVPATGGTVYSAALGMDKLAFGSVLRAAGLPTLTRELLSPDTVPSFEGPYIVKPRFGGSSIGIEVAGDLATARSLAAASQHLRAGAVVEPFRDDLSDLNISFRTYPAFATSAIERPLKARPGGIYSYDEKYLHSDGLTSAPRELPAQIGEELAEQIRGLAKQVAHLTGVDGVARLDFLANEDTHELYVNEVNSIPGAMSLFLWTDTDAATVLLDAVTEAQNTASSALGAAAGFGQGAALQAAGGIAGKLIGLRGQGGS
jgi:D-alanine-D-alanine ligase